MTSRGGYEPEPSQPLQLRDYLDVLRRRVVLVALIALVGAGLAALYASSQQDEYASTASLLIRPIEVDLASTNLRPDQLVNLFTEREVVRSASVATQVSERLEWTPAPETLQRNLQLIVVDETQVLRVTYVASSPERVCGLTIISISLSSASRSNVFSILSTSIR